MHLIIKDAIVNLNPQISYAIESPPVVTEVVSLYLPEIQQIESPLPAKVSLLKEVPVIWRIKSDLGPRFRDEFDFESRKTVAENMKNKYNDSFPVVIQKMVNSNAGNLERKKYLIPKRQTVREFVKMLGEYVKSPTEQNLTYHVEGAGGCYYCLKDEDVNNLWMGKVYAEYKMEDYFLYVIYSLENENLVHGE